MPDVEGGVRTFLRANAEVAAIVGQRVFFGVPKGATEATFPLVTVSRIGGGDDFSEVPIDIALLQIDCWGGIDDSGNGKKAEAVSLLNAVRNACLAIRGRVALNSSVDAAGIFVQSVVWLPDPANDRPRYSVTAEVTAIST
jgi:hypothetical protein